ncbi:MAG: cobalamin-binding protein [Thermoleophilia bacterium]
MRICSLVPGATEVLFALGLGGEVVGVTHECDWPAEAASRPAVTAAALDTDELDGAEIDARIAAAARDGSPLYAIDEAAWAAVAADVVVVQELCTVCAVSTDDVRDITAACGIEAELVVYSPGTLDGVGDAIAELGARLGARVRGAELADAFRRRLAAVDGLVAGAARPRVYVAEWLDPPFAAGHWVPDMVARAGGIDVAGTAGEPSFRMRWTDVAALAPEAVVLAPCGYDLDRTLAEVDPLELAGHLLGTPASAESRVFAVDANALFSRPGPRLADGVALLAHLLHPELASDPGLPWARVML